MSGVEQWIDPLEYRDARTARVDDLRLRDIDNAGNPALQSSYYLVSLAAVGCGFANLANCIENVLQ